VNRCPPSKDRTLQNAKSPVTDRRRRREMKTENLTKASHSLDFVMEDLRRAHSDATTSDNQFEPALFDLMEEALKLQVKLETIKAAATRANAAKKKEPK